MSDDLLTAIDVAYTSRSKNRQAEHIDHSKVVPFLTANAGETTPLSEKRTTWWERPSWLDAFIAVQFLWGALMFLPGIQPYRGLVRALPYVSSLGLLGLYVVRRTPVSLPQSTGLLLSALLLLTLNLLHPTSQLSSGLAQCIFQLSIAAPLFWAYKIIRSARQAERLLIMMFLMNCLSAALGILQVYFPERFMPPEFSSFGLQLNQYYVDSLTYIGNNGRAIIRPPGLTDQPGGAASAGALTALLGLGLLLRTRKPLHVAGILIAVAIGLAVVYLTQVRSILLIAIGSAGLLCVMAVRQGRIVGASRILLAGGGLIVASFVWASSLGGASVDDRFLNLQGRGALQAYQANRGTFLADTVGDLLTEFPLGAGVGRWGMMNTYFGNPAAFRSAPIHVEIQLTGWLLDGGIPMWMLYGGAVLLSLLATVRRSLTREPLLAEVAVVALAIQAFIVGMAMAGPVFNTQLGVLFWTLAAVVHGAAAHDSGSEESLEA